MVALVSLMRMLKKSFIKSLDESLLPSSQASISNYTYTHSHIHINLRGVIDVLIVLNLNEAVSPDNISHEIIMSIALAIV